MPVRWSHLLGESIRGAFGEVMPYMPVSRAEIALKVAPAELGQMERYLLVVIAIASRKSQLATTHAQLAKLASVSSNTVQRTLPKLQSKGLIRLHRQQLGRGTSDETLIWLLVDRYEQKYGATIRVRAARQSR